MIGLDSILLISFVFFGIINQCSLVPFLNITQLVTLTTFYFLSDFCLSFFKKKVFFYLKTIIFICVVFSFVAVPLWSQISLRHKTVNYLAIHDGALQTEIAVRFLFKGINPYATQYFGTPLEQAPYQDPQNPDAINPAMYHYVYFPFTLIRAAVGQFIQKGFGIIDLRFTLFAEYIGLIIVVWLLTKKMQNKFTYLVLFSLNPLITHFLIDGRNDMSAFFYLLLSIYFLIKKKYKISAIILAFSIAAKQSMFPAVILMFAFIFFSKEIKAKFRTYLVTFLISLGLIIGPFFLWDAKSFIDSTVNYLSGATQFNYPIKSIGFAGILISANVFENYHQYFPFWIFQLVTLAPILIFFILKLKEKNKLSYLFVFFGISEAILLYFSRVFSDSYFVLVYSAFVAAYLFREREEARIK